MIVSDHFYVVGLGFFPLYFRAGNKKHQILSPNEPLPFWLELIEDLMCGAGYSYSRIAYRIDVAPSTIQKIATNPNRKPRPKVLHPLIVLHGKVFEGPYATPKARGYWLEKNKTLRSSTFG